MSPEERKAIAKRMGQGWTNADYFPECERRYPRCCSYHEGFDAALALLNKVTVIDGDDVDVVLFAIEATP